jgi:ketosteroid isomerase-like protein
VFYAFNSGDMQAMLDCLSENVAHHVNEGTIRHGREKSAKFCAHMSDCYQENLTNMVIMVSDDGAGCGCCNQVDVSSGLQSRSVTLSANGSKA